MGDKIKRAERITVKRVFIYFSYVPEWWSRRIVSITGRQLPDKSDAWSHMGIAFELSDGRVEAYEALFSKGFAGPEPLENICEKIRKKNGKIEIRDAGIKNIYLQAIYNQCKSWVGTKGYHKWQLASMWFYERFGRWIGWKIPKSPKIVVCSEADARLLYPHIDLRDETRTGFDEVNPNSAWRKWLKLNEELEEERMKIRVSKILLVSFLVAAIGMMIGVSGCATVKMVSPDGTSIQGASVFKDIDAKRKGTDKNGNPYEETYKSRVAGEELGNAVKAAAVLAK